jgi:hypothetical protein
MVKIERTSPAPLAEQIGMVLRDEPVFSVISYLDAFADHHRVRPTVPATNRDAP